VEDLGFFRFHTRGFAGSQHHGLDFVRHAPILELRRCKVKPSASQLGDSP
jgi:hypothetical protein